MINRHVDELIESSYRGTSFEVSCNPIPFSALLSRVSPFRSTSSPEQDQNVGCSREPPFWTTTIALSTVHPCRSHSESSIPLTNTYLVGPTNKEYVNQNTRISVAPIKTYYRHRWKPCPRISTPHSIHYPDQDSIEPPRSIPTYSNPIDPLTCTIDRTMFSTILYIRVEIHPNKSPFTDQHTKPTSDPSRMISMPQWQHHIHRTTCKQQVLLVSDRFISHCLLPA